MTESGKVSQGDRRGGRRWIGMRERKEERDAGREGRKGRESERETKRGRPREGDQGTMCK